MPEAVTPLSLKPEDEACELCVVGDLVVSKKAGGLRALRGLGSFRV